MFCPTPDGMEAYVKVDSCPEEPQLRMKNNEDKDYDDGLYDSDMDVVSFDDDSSSPFFVLLTNPLRTIVQIQIFMTSA